MWFRQGAFPLLACSEWPNRKGRSGCCSLRYRVWVFETHLLSETTGLIFLPILELAPTDLWSHSFRDPLNTGYLGLSQRIDLAWKKTGHTLVPLPSGSLSRRIHLGNGTHPPKYHSAKDSLVTYFTTATLFPMVVSPPNLKRGAPSQKQGT